MIVKTATEIVIVSVVAAAAVAVLRTAVSPVTPETLETPVTPTLDATTTIVMTAIVTVDTTETAVTRRLLHFSQSAVSIRRISLTSYWYIYPFSLSISAAFLLFTPLFSRKFCRN